MEWSLSKMNRIEKAKSGISTNDLRALLRFYDITDKEQAEELIALARRARQGGWWRRYADVGLPELLELIEYESEASEISQFETMFVPGILQTDEYASAVLQVFYDKESAPKRLADLVDLRTRRRGLLSSKNAPKFTFVLDESVIRRLVGDRAITSQQLMHLVNMTEFPNVTIQVVPFSAGLYPGMKGPFEVVQFEDTPDENVVFLESPRGDFISDVPEETESYLEAFKRITETALGLSDSVGLLREAVREAG